MSVLKKLELQPAGGTHWHISKTIKEFGISTEHFKRQGWNKGMPALNKHTKETLQKTVFIIKGSRTPGNR